MLWDNTIIFIYTNRLFNSPLFSELLKILGCRYYFLVGDIQTWKVSLKHNVWGFSERSKGNWNTSNSGDYVAFYVTSPIKRIIGFGLLTTKFKDKSKLWPDEITFDKVLWPYRIMFQNLYTLTNWDKGISVPQTIVLNTGRKVISKSLFAILISKAEKKWRKDLLFLHDIT